MKETDILFDAIVGGDASSAMRQIEALLKQNKSPKSILENCLIPAMAEVGQKFEDNEFFVPELLVAARAMQEGMKILNPLLTASGVAKAGHIIIGTVQGDLHDIGKNLVASMLEGGGFEVVDLGVDVPSEKFVEEARKKDGVILCLSALLTTTMPQMRGVIDSLKQAGIRDSVKVMIGGAPVTEDFAREIGADGYSDNASTAVQLAKQLA